ncbi:hypothetical protein QQF64_018336 [Cirrhinus molitorella]|uniref:Uncharacterized protein n=1 Tax=Cirrhinus molitorella TaxID=172907 RepID=A0ABR3LDT6_9TELE
MIGREKGAVARLKKDNPELIAYHCIINQSVLCASLSDEHAEVMNTMMKMINFLRSSSSYQHRMLREFLKEVCCRTDIFAPQQCEMAQQSKENEKHMDNVAFLVDITSHLNELNIRLQGKDNSVCELMTAVRSFQKKLEVFKEDLQADCAHFPTVQEQVQGQRDVLSFVDFIDKLIVNFSNRFDNFSFGQHLTMFIQNPFLITDVRDSQKEVTQHFKWANVGHLQMQLVDLQADVALKEQFVRTDPSTFWLQVVPETAFPGLRKVALHILTMFGSTYNCEARSQQ